MTYDEWKILVKEYKETNSITRREELWKIAAHEARALCIAIEKLYNKWGMSYVGDDDYQIDKGGHSLKDFDDNCAHIVYSDCWKYGGSCDIGIEVPMKYLEEENIHRKNAELREERLKSLSENIYENQRCIERLNKENNDISKEIIKLLNQRESDPYSKGGEDGK